MAPKPPAKAGGSGAGPSGASAGQGDGSCKGLYMVLGLCLGIGLMYYVYRTYIRIDVVTDGRPVFVCTRKAVEAVGSKLAKMSGSSGGPPRRPFKFPKWFVKSVKIGFGLLAARFLWRGYWKYLHRILFPKRFCTRNIILPPTFPLPERLKDQIGDVCAPPDEDCW